MADVRQRLVWVWRELRAEHPEMDEAALEAIAGRDPASILVEEVMRLRAENARLREHARWDQLRRTPRAPRS